MPNTDIIEELPGNWLMWYCRTILAQVLQTLVAYNIAVPTLSSNHTPMGPVWDRLWCRTLSYVPTRVVRGEDDHTLKLYLIWEWVSWKYITSTLAILPNFVHARSEITQWKDAITKLYSDQNDLHDLIPSVSRLCISRLDLKSFTTTDTFATARNPRRVLNKLIQQIAEGRVCLSMLFEADAMSGLEVWVKLWLWATIWGRFLPIIWMNYQEATGTGSTWILMIVLVYWQGVHEDSLVDARVPPRCIPVSMIRALIVVQGRTFVSRPHWLFWWRSLTTWSIFAGSSLPPVVRVITSYRGSCISCCVLHR
jgi:hypothetical protein